MSVISFSPAFKSVASNGWEYSCHTPRSVLYRKALVETGRTLPAGLYLARLSQGEASRELTVREFGREAPAALVGRQGAVAQVVGVLVADPHGELIALLRMDGAPLPSTTIAVTPAFLKAAATSAK